MLKILTSILILLNPVMGFFSTTPPVQPKNASQNEAALFEYEEFRLPMSEGMFLAAQLVPSYPWRNWNIADPDITAQTALILDTDRQRILWQKNGPYDTRPIASLTKLMTALVVLDNAKLEDVFTVSREAVATYGEEGRLVVGEQLSVKSLLSAMLIESSNDAAAALAENIYRQNNKNFVELMNQKAKALGLKNTSFKDPTGLDPQNSASAWDLNILMREFLKYPVLKEIAHTPLMTFTSTDGRFQHKITSTNQLLEKIPEIIAGKTGYTEEAGDCIILAAKPPQGQGAIIYIIMNSQDRFGESAKLIQWTKEAYLW